MKNIFFGSITLALFAVAITLIDMSCQKTDAQLSRSSSPASGGVVLYSKLAIQQVIPFTHIDSAGNTIMDKKDTLYRHDLYICNLDGSNQRQIPITLPAGLEAVTGEPRLAANGTSIVFDASPVPVYVNGMYTVPDIPGQGVYTCGIDGSGLKLILARDVGRVGSINLWDAY